MSGTTTFGAKLNRHFNEESVNFLKQVHSSHSRKPSQAEVRLSASKVAASASDAYGTLRASRQAVTIVNQLTSHKKLSPMINATAINKGGSKKVRDEFPSDLLAAAAINDVFHLRFRLIIPTTMNFCRMPRSTRLPIRYRRESALKANRWNWIVSRS
jgi:hypothetical protein